MPKRLLILVVALVALAAACSSSAKKVETSTKSPATNASGGPPTATMVTSKGTIVLELDTKNAPKAAGRFLELAKKGFYDGLTFHRVVPNFVIQGGDPDGTGGGGTGESVAGEVPQDNYPIGSLAAAKTGADPPGTFDCQFFIVTGEAGETLPNEYARFGKVTSGLDVAKSIEALAPPEGDGAPTEKVTINKVTVSGA
jgi:cyclophilin family peptidyl-prolyl cis-trans isomerase